MKKIFITCIICSAVLIGCKKDDPSNTELLTKGAWTQTAQKYNPSVPYLVGDSTSSDIIYVADFFDLLYDCAKDDLLSFQANGLYKWETGPITCGNNGENITTESTVYEQGNWVLNSTETKLTFSSGSYFLDYNITELSESKLVLTTNFQLDTSGIEYTQTNEYVR